MQASVARAKAKILLWNDPNHREARKRAFSPELVEHPDLAYHGTSSFFLGAILRRGIVPNWRGLHEFGIEIEDSDYGSIWTTLYERALQEAIRAQTQYGRYPLLVIGRIDPQSVRPVEDDLQMLRVIHPVTLRGANQIIAVFELIPHGGTRRHIPLLRYGRTPEQFRFDHALTDAGQSDK